MEKARFCKDPDFKYSAFSGTLAGKRKLVLNKHFFQ